MTSQDPVADKKIDEVVNDPNSISKTKSTTSQGPMLSRNQSTSSGRGGAEFEKSVCFQPVCTSFRRMINFVGACCALLNAVLDIIYCYKTPYVMKMIFLLTCVFILVRIVFTFVMGQYYYTKYVRQYKPNIYAIDDGKGNGTQTAGQRSADINNSGVNLYASLHLLFYTGFFRMLPSKDFPFELGIAYAMELFFQLIPNMFCQVFNNAETRQDVTVIQSAALVMKLICLLLMITEIIMMMWEVTKNKDQRKLGIPGFEELSEEERRMQNHKRMSFIGYVSMFVFVVLLVLVALFSKGRECGPQQALENAVCKDCWEETCLNCTEKAQTCELCKPGYFLTSYGACVDCDSEFEHKCNGCTSKDDGETMQCEECASGYRLEQGRCVSCTDSEHCAVCSSDRCRECKQGYRMDSKGNCKPCSDIKHCVRCGDVEGYCDFCDYNIAYLTEGKCSLCKEENGWTSDGAGGCKCDNYVNAKEGNICQTCEQAIPGCSRCEQTDLPGQSLFVEIGHAEGLSKNKGKYLKCTQCGSKQNKMYEEKTTGQCKYCGTSLPGCDTCSKDGSSCVRCKKGYFSYVDGGKVKCSGCQRFGKACKSCSLRGSCRDCGRGYWLMSGVCFKAIF